MPIQALRRDLCRIAVFLQEARPHVALQRFDDWYEHDGLHFAKGSLDFHGLFALIGSSRAIFEAVPGDDRVHVGIAPADASWYLRFHACWSDDDETLEGDYDVTLGQDFAVRFRDIVPTLEAAIDEEDSQGFFSRIRIRV